MNTIGICIERTSNGLQRLFTTADECGWTTEVTDIRTILSAVYSASPDKAAIFMRFSAKGAYIVVAHGISGRVGDYIAAWIFVPCDIDIAGSELAGIISTVKAQIFSPEIDSHLLTSLAERKYDTVETVDYAPSGNDDVFALIKAGRVSFDDLVGKYRYQNGYDRFKAIIVDSGLPDSMPVKPESTTTLDVRKFSELFVFCPPRPTDIPDGVTVHFDNETKDVFDTPLRLAKGTAVKVLFERKGFSDIHLTTSVEENNQICDIPREWTWRFTITSDKFNVIAAHKASVKVKDPHITVNGKELSFAGLEISESDARAANVKVSADGYEAAEETIDLLNTMCYTIRLHRAVRRRTYDIDFGKGRDGKITIESKYLPLDESKTPLIDYVVRSGNLEFDSLAALRRMLYGFIAGAALIGAAWGGMALWNHLIQKPATEQTDPQAANGTKPETAPGPETATDDSVSTNAQTDSVAGTITETPTDSILVK